MEDGRWRGDRCVIVWEAGGKFAQGALVGKQSIPEEELEGSLGKGLRVGLGLGWAFFLAPGRVPKKEASGREGSEFLALGVAGSGGHGLQRRAASAGKADLGGPARRSPGLKGDSAPGGVSHAAAVPPALIPPAPLVPGRTARRGCGRLRQAPRGWAREGRRRLERGRWRREAASEPWQAPSRARASEWGPGACDPRAAVVPARRPAVGGRSAPA